MKLKCDEVRRSAALDDALLNIFYPFPVKYVKVNSPQTFPSMQLWTWIVLDFQIKANMWQHLHNTSASQYYMTGPIAISENV